jgi:hypothetical protein
MWWMLLAFFGMISCSSEDTEWKRRAEEFKESKPHPLELALTDSSLRAQNVHEDTLRDYTLSILIRGEDGSLRLWYPDRELDFPTLTPGCSQEWTFDVLGLDAIPDDSQILLGRPEVDTEFLLAWICVDGKFVPTLLHVPE